ncbi:MAG: amidohydrolase family protein [Blastomonas sp.]
MKRFLLTASVALAAIASPAMAQNVAITGGKLVVGDGSAPVENATVVIRNGKVVAAGSGIAVPAGMEQVDASGKWVTPGIFAGFSRVGLIEVDAVSQTNDEDADHSPFSAAIDVVPAINPSASSIAVNRAAGVTRAVVAPGAGRTIFGGFGAIVDLGEDYDAVTTSHAFQFVELGETGSSRAGGSRAAAHTLFRAMLSEARRYARNPAAFESDLLTRQDAEALGEIVDGRTRLLVHVERAADIIQTLKLRQEFPALKLVIVGAAEGWLVADQIAVAGVPVIASALNDLPEYFEKTAATQSNIGRMKRAGVQVSIGMINDRDAHQLRYSTQYAGNLVALNRVPGATGLSWDEAFATITSGPAKALGLDGAMGSLKAGRVGDVVIWDGDPLELSSAPVEVYVDGVRQSLENRQSKLRDRYRSLDEGQLPRAYDR